jgi:DNA-binding GntR family transcriptional regulator
MLKIETPNIYEDLRSRLIEAKFDYGQKLKPADLQASYGCSANTIRVVLFRLASENLAIFEDQKGFRVPKMSPQKQHELTQMRILLEAEGASLSMKQGGVAWEAALSAQHYKLKHLEKRISAATDTSVFITHWIRAEEEFHQALISACGSQILKDMHRLIYAQFRQQLITTDRTFVFLTENIDQHQEIVDAALNGDEAMVRARIHDHLKRNMIPQDPKIIQLATGSKSSVW